MTKCVFCQDKGGLTIKAEFRFKKEKGTFWVHITCVNYLDSIYFKDEKKNVVLSCLEGGPMKCLFKTKNLVKDHCYICNFKQEQCTLLKCDKAACKKYFHVRCAMTEKIILDWEAMGGLDGTKEIFCQTHKKIRKKPEKSIFDKNRLKQIYATHYESSDSGAEKSPVRKPDRKGTKKISKSNQKQIQKFVIGNKIRKN